jgi:exodeoxyribonuclease VII small subunit
MKKNNKQSLSEAYKELEKITQEFESNEIDLEKGIPKFKKALELARYLKRKISEIENEIEEIKDDFKDVYENTKDIDSEDIDSRDDIKNH